MHQPVVLHIDDDPQDLLLMQEAFAAITFQARLIGLPDGVHGQEYLLGCPKYADRTRFPLPDLILCDLKMPNLNGLGFIEWMRCKSPVVVPIIVLCASGYIGDIQQLVQTGVADVFVKPTTLYEWQTQARLIAAAVESTMKSRPSHQPANGF